MQQAKHTLHIDLLIKKKYHFLRHFILFLFLLIVAFQAVSGTFKEPYEIIYIFFINLLGTSVCIYTNHYVLIPRYLFKKKMTAYVISLLLLIIVVIFFFSSLTIPLYQKNEIQGVPPDDTSWFIMPLFYLYTLINVIAVCAGITSIELLRRWIIHDRHIEELEQTTMENELQQLKNQINPHFLFNMLNNANTLVREDREKASKVLNQLDEMLSYQMNDSTRTSVYLRDDIQFLSGFLELEKIRRDNFEFAVSTEGDIMNISVPPLLFIPFVENAVKHNPDSDNLSFVHLIFKVKNKELSFTCKNSKPKIPIKIKAGGLGLNNIQRRLELLYKDNFCLETEETDTTYTVFLILNI